MNPVLTLKTTWMIHLLYALSLLTLPSGAYAGTQDLSANDKAHSEPVMNEHHSLEDYILTGLKYNPGLKSEWNKYRAALSMPVTQGALPDPMISYKSEKLDSGEGEREIGLAQKLPWFGRLNLKAEKSSDMAKAAYCDYLQSRLSLIQQIEYYYFEYSLLYESIRLVNDNLLLLKNMDPIVQSRIQGGGDQNNLIKLQVEIGRLENYLTTLNSKRPALSLKLSQLLGIQSGLLPWPQSPSTELVHIDARQSLQVMLAKNPQLKKLQFLQMAARKATDIARSERFPDFEIGMEYMIPDRDMTNMTGEEKDVRLMFKASLPLWFSKNAAKIRETRSFEDSLSLMEENTINDLTSKHALLMFTIEDSARQCLLYRDTLISRAKQSLNLTETSYQTGKSSLLDVIDSWRTLLQFELEYRQTVIRHKQSLSELKLLEGSNEEDIDHV